MRISETRAPVTDDAGALVMPISDKTGLQDFQDMKRHLRLWTLVAVNVSHHSPK